MNSISLLFIFFTSRSRLLIVRVLIVLIVLIEFRIIFDLSSFQIYLKFKLNIRL